MTPGQRFSAATITVWGAVIAVIGPTPGLARPSAVAIHAVAPAAFTLRYATQGWADLTQAGAAQVACAGDPSACHDRTAAATWVDTDDDPATINSSSDRLTVPAGASVDWAGLYWFGDRGTRTADTPPRCDAAAEGAPPAGPPPAPEHANQVKLKLDSAAYATATASALADVASPSGGSGFQAYADITALLRPHQTPASAKTVTLTVADLQVAQGAGCVGGWTALLAYAYPGGPDPSSAPAYRGVTVFDGVVAAGSGVSAEIRLDGLQTPAMDGLDARLAMALGASGPLAADGLTINGAGLTLTGGEDGRGYRRTTAPVPASALRAGATDATVRLATARDAFVAAVLGLTHRMPAQVDLSVSTTVAPMQAPVGGEAALTVTVRNDATLPATGVVVTAHLPAGLTLVEPVAGYEAETGAWSVGRLAPGGTAALTLRVRVAQAGGLVTTAEVTASELPDVDSTPGDGAPAQDDVAFVTLTGTEAPASPTTGPLGAEPAPPDTALPVPILPLALIGIGLFLLGVLMISIVALRNRTAVTWRR